MTEGRGDSQLLECRECNIQWSRRDRGSFCPLCAHKARLTVVEGELEFHKRTANRYRKLLDQVTKTLKEEF